MNLMVLNLFHMKDKKVPVFVRGETKQKQRTFKEQVESSKMDLLLQLKKTIRPFMFHCYKIIHQFKVIRNVKANVTQHEVLLHFDFSQNYACKYSSEVQSFHFGGNRKQVSLHTSVLYYNPTGDAIKHKSFCTLSESLRHDPSSICAHLDPVITKLKELVPNLKKIHFLSDGPSTQYKNKTCSSCWENF